MRADISVKIRQLISLLERLHELIVRRNLYQLIESGAPQEDMAHMVCEYRRHWRDMSYLVQRARLNRNGTALRALMNH